MAAAERVLLREAKAGQIPWTAEDVDPPGAPIDELWQQSTLKPQLAQNEATFVTPWRVGTGFGDLGFETIKVGGIKFKRAAVEALLPVGAVLPAAGSGDVAGATAAAVPPTTAARLQTPKGFCKPWLKRLAPKRGENETAEAFHERLSKESGGKWGPDTIKNVLSKLRQEATSAAPSLKKSQK
jgi:hypothetical protein